MLGSALPLTAEVPALGTLLAASPMKTLGIALAAAVIAYFCGCLNGAILTSKLFYHEDVRHHGSGNAGLTNFYRCYGARYAPLVILCDMLKAVAAVLVGRWLFTLLGFPLLGEYFAALFCVIGHMFPVTAQFKGGKGILCSGTLLLMLDWRIALAGWGLFLLLWLTTRYVSLGSVAAAVSFPISTFFCFRTLVLTVLSLLIAGLVLWAHRGNIVRLVQGKESKFRWHGKEDKT